MKLVAKIRDEELFQKWTHELSAVLCEVDDQGVIEKVVYHSGNKTVLLNRPQRLSEQLATRVKADGFLVDQLEIDEVQGQVKIVQGSQE